MIFFGILLGTSRISLFGNLLIGKVHFATGEGPIREGEGSIRADQKF